MTLIGFGTFTAGERTVRKGRNPRTGRVINIPASIAPKFRPGKALKNVLQGNGAKAKKKGK